MIWSCGGCGGCGGWGVDVLQRKCVCVCDNC